MDTQGATLRGVPGRARFGEATRGARERLTPFRGASPCSQRCPLCHAWSPSGTRVVTAPPQDPWFLTDLPPNALKMVRAARTQVNRPASAAELHACGHARRAGQRVLGCAPQQA